METINGKRVESVMEDLCRPFYPNEIRRSESTKEAYISASTLQKRLDRVLGKHMWSFALSGQKLYQLQDGLYGFASGTVTVYTDAGKMISRSASGCVRLYGSVSDVSAGQLDGYGKALCDDIFVKACEKLGMGTQPEGQKAKNPLPEKEHTPNEATAVTNEQSTYQVEILGEFMALDKGGAKCPVRCQGKRFMLYFWKDTWNELNKAYPKSFAIGGRLNSLSFIGKKGLFKGREQLEFISLPTVS